MTTAPTVAGRTEPGRTAPGRRLGAADGAALIVSNVVGIGIFTTPGIVAGLVGGPLPYLGVWLAGGVLALIGGLVYAELGGAYPEAGGEYVYIREAFGPAAAFLSGWTSLIAGFSGAIAAGAVGFALYLERIVPGLARGRAVWTAGVGDVAIEITPRRLVALGLVLVLALVHGRGLEPGRRLQAALAVLSVATIAALVAAGFAGTDPAAMAAPLTAPPAGAGPAGEGGVFLALVLVMFTYSGWNAASYVAGEIRSPARNLRLAVIAGVLIVIALYAGLNLLYVRALPFADLAGSTAVAEGVAAATLGATGGAAVAVVVALALASGVSAMLMTGPRVYYAMAVDGALPAAFRRVDARTGVPTFGVWAQAVWAAGLVLTGTFEALLTYTGFAVVLFGAAAVAALFVLRRRPGYGSGRQLGAWGYPWAPALFLLVSGAMLIQAIRFAPGPSLAGAALIAAGLPLHFWSRHRPGHSTEASPPVSTAAPGDPS